MESLTAKTVIIGSSKTQILYEHIPKSIQMGIGPYQLAFTLLFKVRGKPLFWW